MSLPAFAPLPPAHVRSTLAATEWEAFLESWCALLELTSRLPDSDQINVESKNASLYEFLASFYHELAQVQTHDRTLTGTSATTLRKLCFGWTRKILLSERDLPKALSTWTFLANFCRAHLRNPSLNNVVDHVWRSRGNVYAPQLEKQRDKCITLLETGKADHAVESFSALAPVLHCSGQAGALFVIGSDFLDALVAAYDRSMNDQHHKAFSSIAVLGLTSLLRIEPPNSSILSDHLYSLRAYADKTTATPTILADIVTNHRICAKLRKLASAKTPERLFKLLDNLETYYSSAIARPRKHESRSKNHRPHQIDETQIHKMSLVTQVQDLFPDLGSGFVLRLLDEYRDSVEELTAHLLEDALPSHLGSLDRSEEAPINNPTPQARIDHLAPRSTPSLPEPFIPERKNIFDNDELDRLVHDTSKLHIGKQTRLISTDPQPNQKAAILSALASFDSDDDERDDTYDVEDVGGTIDSLHTADREVEPITRSQQQQHQDEIDQHLFRAWKSSPNLFDRGVDVRRSQPRDALKRETGLTDEAIEGWAIMLQREPKRLLKLEARAADTHFDGQQTALARSAYRGTDGTETEDSDVAADSDRARGGMGGNRGSRGSGRGRGRGRGGRGGAGDVAGPSNETSTANAQRRKEANKGSRANHNRRNQRAKKVARAGFPG